MKEKTQADTEFFRVMLSEADGQTTLLSDDDPSLRVRDGEYADYAVSFSQLQPEAAAALPALLKDGGFAADGLFLSRLCLFTSPAQRAEGSAFLHRFPISGR